MITEETFHFAMKIKFSNETQVVKAFRP